MIFGLSLQDPRVRHISQGERDLMRIAQTTNEFNSFYKETTMGDEIRFIESDYRNNISTPCQHNELRFDDHTPMITMKHHEHKVGVEATVVFEK